MSFCSHLIYDEREHIRSTRKSIDTTGRDVVPLRVLDKQVPRYVWAEIGSSRAKVVVYVDGQNNKKKYNPI